MTHDDREREDVDAADALGGAGALPLPDGQARGAVPIERHEPGGEVAPEAVEEPGTEPGDRGDPGPSARTPTTAPSPGPSP